MDCINLGPCNLYYRACTNRARHLRSLPHECESTPAEPLRLRSCITRKRYIKYIPDNLNDVMHCIALHQINSHRFVLCMWCFLPNGSSKDIERCGTYSWTQSNPLLIITTTATTARAKKLKPRHNKTTATQQHCKGCCHDWQVTLWDISL